MPYYVTYEEDGTIVQTRMADMATDSERQVQFPEYIETNGKKIDLVTLNLVDLPPPVILD